MKARQRVLDPRDSTPTIRTNLPWPSPNFESPSDVESTDPVNAADNNEYVVVVRVRSGTGERRLQSRQTIVVTVTDVEESPSRPAEPSVTTVPGNAGSLDVAWTAPNNLGGGPDIVGYSLRYQIAGSGNWVVWDPAGLVTTATLTGLSPDTQYGVQVKALNDEANSDWSLSGIGRTAVNNPPAFPPGPLTRSVAENTAANEPVGAPVRATDADTGHTLAYTLEGTDASSFGIDGSTGQILTKAALDFEGKPSYALTAKADDGNGGTATTAVTVSVTDADEPPDAPWAPVVTPVTGSTTSLAVSWSKRPDQGRPAITDYDVRHCEGAEADCTSGTDFTAHHHTGPSSSTTLSGLSEGTRYQVQVRATNDEGTSDWSPSGSSTTTTNRAPVFNDGPSAIRTVAENTAPGTNIGAPLGATDTDGDALAYSLAGMDGGAFDIDDATGQILTRTALDFEAKPSYALTVQADDGNSGTATIAVTVTVTDVHEPPEAPGTPEVTPQPGTSTSLAVRWTTPPTGGGPPLESYDLRWREAGAGTWTGGLEDLTTTSTIITGLTPDTDHDVQVRATNDEGDGDWSQPGTGRTAEPPRRGLTAQGVFPLPDPWGERDAQDRIREWNGGIRVCWTPVGFSPVDDLEPDSYEFQRRHFAPGAVADLDNGGGLTAFSAWKSAPTQYYNPRSAEQVRVQMQACNQDSGIGFIDYVIVGYHYTYRMRARKKSDGDWVVSEQAIGVVYNPTNPLRSAIRTLAELLPEEDEMPDPVPQSMEASWWGSVSRAPTSCGCTADR